MNANIKLKKFGFRTIIPHAGAFYNVLQNNRARLEPWFWWAGQNTTPNLLKTIAFMTLYVLDTKRKKLIYKLSKSKKYDEQFLIFKESKLAGMTGLDNIDNDKKNAELWYFLTAENEGQGTMSASLKLIEDYAFKTKDMNMLYAKTAAGNERSESLLKRNDYNIGRVEYDVPTSPRNPKITDLMTWVKHR
ncbi:MAG: GNAT family N-acetyltransferase [Rickettsiales bacterium]|jgi:RimJ/RimL family protein N-acetyltransferase|nr:GNAT family N-acetyltransferase [Rickettsiales bacterium]